MKFLEQILKEDPYTYKMFCKNCDIFFEIDDPRDKECPYCEQSDRVSVYSLIDKKTSKAEELASDAA